MRLTRYTDYGLRVLMYLGMQPGELATIRDISDAYGISRNHVMKVVHALGKLGYIETIRGKGGGIRLAQSAESVNVGELVRRMESDFELVECFGPANQCVLTGCCVLPGAISEALKAFLAVLDGYTLADLLVPRRRIRQALLG